MRDHGNWSIVKFQSTISGITQGNSSFNGRRGNHRPNVYNKSSPRWKTLSLDTFVLHSWTFALWWLENFTRWYKMCIIQRNSNQPWSSGNRWWMGGMFDRGISMISPIPNMLPVCNNSGVWWALETIWPMDETQGCYGWRYIVESIKDGEYSSY